MKKISSLSALRLPLSLIVFHLLITQLSFGQDCNTQAAIKPSTLLRGTDDISSPTGKMSSIEMAKMKPHLVKAENWIKNKLSNFTGAKLYYSNEFYPDYQNGGPISVNFYKATGITSSSSSKMRFFAYYCYDNNNTIQTEAESGSFVTVTFNNVFASALCTDVGVFTVNGKSAFKILEKDRSEGRIDFYDLRAKSNVNDNIYTSKHNIILIRNSDKPVFIPVTRKEYLEQMLKDLELYKTKSKDFMDSFYKSQVKGFEEEMRIYKTMDKSYTPEKEAKRRQWFNEDLNPEKLTKDLKKLEDEVNGANQIITEYLGKPQEWLSRGFSSFYNFSTYDPKGVKKYFDDLDVFTESREDYTRSEIVSINPAYFNKSLSSDAPQLIMVHLSKKSYPHMLKVTKLVMQPGALAPLEAILNPGKSVAATVLPAEKVSNYTLKHLSKLTKLAALTVPADMKPSANPVANNYNSTTPAAKFSFEIPARSPKLDQLPKTLNTDSYKAYILQLNTSISNAVKPDEKKKADDYVMNKKLSQSKDISNIAFASWLQNAPTASLYLYSKALAANPLDVLAANNFSAFLIMGGLPEKSIPILEYWNKQKQGEATLLGNLGIAYYRLGDPDKAANYLQQCVQLDTLNAPANKILCLMYLKKGDTKKAEEHGIKSLTTSYDEQVTDILRQLNNKTKPGEIMSRLPVTEFPMLKRIYLPSMPSNLDEMEQFQIELEAEKRSMEMTIANIDSKTPKINDDLSQTILMASLKQGISPLRIKAQYIIMEGMQTYQRESIRESDVFKYQLKKLAVPFNINTTAISKKYVEKINKLESGEGGDDDEIDALELAKCNEINAEIVKYLAGLSPLVNGYAQRQEFIARKFYRDYAYWAPYWMPETTLSFPSIERDYLKALSGILSEYKIITKSNCSVYEPLAKKDGALKKWEDEFCANFKGKIGIGPAKMTWTCSSWGIEGGEGIVGEFEMNFADDGAFEEFTAGAGLGATWRIGDENIVNIEAGASVKEFIKIGPDKTTGEWGVKDIGVKSEAALEGSIGNIGAEIKVLELSVAVNAGLDAGGVAAPLLNLN